MAYFKRNALKIGIIVTVLLSSFFCAYSIYNYKGNTVSNGTIMAQHSFGLGGEKQVKGPNRQVPDSVENKDMGAPDDNNRFSTNGEVEQAPNNPKGSAGQSHGNMHQNKSMIGVSQGTSNGYSKYLIAYGIVFAAVFIIMYRLHKYKKIKISASNEKILITGLLAIGLILRISFGLLADGHPFDLSTFKNWATSAANNFLGFYSGPKTSDYPPLYIYVLFMIGKIAKVTAMSKYFTLLIKLPAIFADIASAYIIYKVGKKYVSSEISILISAAYIFNPAIFINSVFWGQVDSFFTFIVVCSLFLMSEGKFCLSYIMFTLGVLMKPQGIIYLPVLFFELVRQKRVQNFIKAIFFAVITTLIVILPFSLNSGVTWIVKLFSNTLGEYPYASVNGYNFYSLLGKNYVYDSNTFFLFSYHVWGMIFIIMITLFSWFIYIRGNSKIYGFLAALIQISGVFTFSTRMHERYLFPAVALAILAYIYIKDKRLLLLGAGYSISIYVNTHVVLFQTNSGINSSANSPILFICSLLNVLLFAYLAKVSWDITVRKK